MKIKYTFANLVIIILLASCGPVLSPPAVLPTISPTTAITLLSTQQTMMPRSTLWYTIVTAPPAPPDVWVMPTNTQRPTIPTSTPVPTPTPYPTAGVVKANAVAFIGGHNSNSLDTSLWVANIDGSGERKLVEIAYNEKDGWTNNPLLRWSPNGKWISYIESHELWIISPDGSRKRKLLSLPDTRGFFNYAWSPDSSKIAYQNTVSDKDKPTKTPTPGPQSGMAPYLVGMIDIATGKVSELSSHEANAGIPILLWSPNGRDLLFIKGYSLVLFEVAARKVVKEIKRGCGLERNMSWSPNGKWFSHTDNGVGRYSRQWICVGGLDGLNREINVDGTATTPVWDKTGNFLYFVARKTNPDSIPNLQIDERLLRYDPKTQQTERLLSLRDQQTVDYTQSVSISPDGRTLFLESQSSENQYAFMFVDIKSLSTTKFTIAIEGQIQLHFPSPMWSPDSQKIIFFVRNLNPINYGIKYSDSGLLYTVDIKTGKTSIFSGVHAVENAQVSPIAVFP